ncbi:hypothetical protein AKJ61_00820 [candidate division MSBL1 archaeon SCGC-AAA259B11]|uniref:Uncharacterized protein n=1 Tax=candidate division MSBL1 archaeon SCGC-AAA259B11 TaxID=1698260 RepID=A0A133U847_9EURY|nr:hypothetical protein AKJ61_00820 [candidate division MSBL1 archaeon SCGC-AAA259B11]
MGKHGQLDAARIDGAERNDDVEIGGEVKDMAIRNPIKQETAEKLVPILEEYLRDHFDIEDPEIYIMEDRLPRNRQPPVGYYKKAKDHIVDVIVFKTGVRIQSIDNEGMAEKNIRDLRDYGYGTGGDEGGQ